MFVYDLVNFNRNQAYLARVQLAVLDHNAHSERKGAVDNKGEQLFHRKYRKQSKKWDVTPLKSNKTYKYIPELIQAVFEERTVSISSMKRAITLPENHPTKIQHTIAHLQPDNTIDIVKNKKSRFSDQ